MSGYPESKKNQIIFLVLSVWYLKYFLLFQLYDRNFYDMKRASFTFFLHGFGEG